MSRSPWAWTENRFGHLARGGSSLTAMERVATVVMLMLAFFPAAALGKVGDPHRRGSTGSATQASRIAGAAHSKSHNSGPPRAARPAQHARRSSREILALGRGYSAPHGSTAVKVLQRHLVKAGFPPGPIDGRYGLLTEHAVIRFQAVHGLQVDGIAGPLTLAALAVAEPVLQPGTGYVRGSSGAVRKLQRDLATAGYSPGPSDGRFGPRTERAVMRLQHARHLVTDGIAGPRTLRQLRAILARRSRPHPHRASLRPRSAHHRSRPGSGRPSRPPTPARSAAPQPRRATHSAGSPSILWIVLLACLLMAMVGGMVWLRDRGRGDRSHGEPLRPEAHPEGAAQGLADERGNSAAAFELGVMLVLARHRAAARNAFRRRDPRRRPNPEFDLGALLPQEESRVAAEQAFQLADERGHAGAACNLGVLLEQRGDMTGAREAYCRADERGHPVGAYNLGALLEQEGDMRGAIDAYGRADQRGDSKGAYSLGVLLERRGDRSGAKAAYRRADQRGDPRGAANLGLLLKQEGDRAGALRALQRANRNGSAATIPAARAALLELSPIDDIQRFPNGGEETAAVSDPDTARPPAQRGDQLR